MLSECAQLDSELEIEDYRLNWDNQRWSNLTCMFIQLVDNVSEIYIMILLS